ncbi:GDSL esterase/lipase 2 [Camellia lanceoleosa]|uniref:GDSL esterase/lipase 2 n=1 Tax=Camellia lanceoleosa TaxID=1840588 RepID=A0ACC0I0C5_9ERIC|nr:GDSL esterase/lipase 2 [Camellia lanceoleosa]
MASKSSRRKLILSEVEATLEISKALGIDFEGKDKEVISKLKELEANDMKKENQTTKLNCIFTDQMENFNLMKNISVLVVLALLILIPKYSCHAHRRPSDDNHVALFIFGDSIFDVGNNNNINTTIFFQANFWPYGETTFNYPTGRCCDGRLIPDFIAEYAKLPLIPPYMQLSNNHQFTNGVNFASGGAGALVETFKGLVIDLKTQVANFKKVEKSLMKQLGDKEAKKILSRAIYLISIGSNDYFTIFATNSSVFKSYPREEYVEMVIGNLTQVVQEIYETGGRKFGFVGVGPLGCVPFARVMLNQENSGECLEELTTRVKLHNIALSKVLQKLESQLEGFLYSNFDLYTSWGERMDNPSKYGFKEGKSACCGSGPYRGINSCGGMRRVKEYELCNNVSEYVLFDTTHPTERAYQQFASLMWNGTPSTVWPYNLEVLFEHK